MNLFGFIWKRGGPVAAHRLTSVALWLALLGVSLPAMAEPLGHDAVEPADEDARGPREVTLDEVVVTGQAEEQGSNLSTVTVQDARRRGDRSVVEALDHDPSLSQSTGRRGERTFSLRGFDQRQVTVLVDGAPSYIPYDGGVDLGLFPVEALDHITVVKGPGSALYGPNGMGGAVNIVTRRPGSGPLASLLAETGLGDALQLGASHALTIGPVGYTLYGGWRRRAAFPLSDDFAADPRENGFWRDNSDSDVYHLGANLRARLGGGHSVTAGLLWVDGEHGVPPGLAEPVVRYWRFSLWRSVGVTLGHRASYLDGRLELDELAFIRLFDNRVDSYDDATYSSQQTARAFHSTYHDQLAGARVRGRWHLAGTPWGPTDLRLWLGGQFDRHSEDPDTNLKEPITRGLLTLSPEAEAFFGQRWAVTAGFQLDLELPGEGLSAAAASRVGLGPLLAVRFDPLDALTLRASVARRSRFPTLKERFATAGGRRVPNADLGPETAWHVGLEASWRGPAGLRLDLGVHDAEVDGLVELVPLGGGQEQMQNIPGARLLGAELGLTARPWRWLGLRAGYAFLHARRSEEREGSDRLAYRPEHRATLELNVTPLGWLDLHSQLRISGTRPFQDPAGGTWDELPAHAVWDARLAVRINRFVTLHGQLRNILDSDVMSEAGYPDPGREIWVGIRGAYRQPKAGPRSLEPTFDDNYTAIRNDLTASTAAPRLYRDTPTRPDQ